MRDGERGPFDWKGSFLPLQTSEEEWPAVQQRLRDAYEAVVAFAASQRDEAPNGDLSGSVLALRRTGIVAVMLLRRGRPALPAIIPLTFVLIMSVLALLVQMGTFWQDRNWLLLVLDVIILVAAVWVIVEAVGAGVTHLAVGDRAALGIVRPPDPEQCPGADGGGQRSVVPDGFFAF